MSNAVLPSMPGLGWSVIKTPNWKTIVQETASGKEVRQSLMTYPLWDFTLTFSVLRGANGYTEMTELAGFFNERQGMYDTWLFDDPSDDSVTSQSFGTGDGSTVAFQLIRTMNGFNEPIQNVNGSPSIYINGVLQSSGYTIGSTGIVTFTAAPAAAAALTWTGAFYFRCRFLQDLAEFDQFAKDVWSLKTLKFRSVKL